MRKENIENQIFFNKFKPLKLINKSAHSYLYRGINIINKELVSIKIENRITMKNYLESEAYILFYLKGFGIPNLLSFGKKGKYKILVEELLGPSLKEISKLIQIKNGFPIKDICMIALQGLDRLEYIHSKNIIHRDIKPHNFLIGRKDAKIIYLIDFGLAKKYKSSRTGKFIKFTNLRLFFGSLAYSSLNANAGYEQCRRDDLESFGYMLIGLAKKYLPWMNFETKKNKKEEVFEVYKLKKGIKLEKLCEGLPEEFIDYIKYCRKLKFEQEPNYNYLRNLFIFILMKENQKNDLNFFWTNKKDAKSATKNYENNSNSKRDIHKRLYNSVKKSLEKKRKEGKNNTLKSDYSLSNYSLNKVSDIQNNKKGDQKINLNLKKLYDKSKISKKCYNPDNNNIEKAFTIHKIDEQKYYSSSNNLISNRFIFADKSYNSKEQFENIKIKHKTIIYYNIRKNKSINNTKNATSKNYSTLEDNIINTIKSRKINTNNYNYNYNEISYQTPSHYRIFTENKCKLTSKKLNLNENKNRFKSYITYTFHNKEKNISILNHKNNFEKYGYFSFENSNKNINFK